MEKILDLIPPYLVIFLALIISMMKIFRKAGAPGWAFLVPIYNVIVLLDIIGKPWWWLLLLLVPGLNIYILLRIWHDLSLSFGRGAGFTVGLILLWPIFLPILAFGKIEYVRLGTK